MSSHMNTYTALEIPPGLREMLREFTVCVLQDKPNDLYEYAAEYFPDKHKELILNRKLKEGRAVQMYINVDSDDDGEPEVRPKSTNHRFMRRQSVSAERYDPEADTDEGINTPTYPKSDEQRARLMGAVKPILMFKALDDEQLNKVIDAFFEHKAEVNDNIIVEGDDGDNFYIIETGTYEALLGEEQRIVHTYRGEGYFGELALMYNQPRAATVRACTEGTLWAMDRLSFRQIVLKSAFQKHKMYEDLLGNVPMLGTLNTIERKNLTDAFVSKEYEDGEVIIREGEEADGMYFIEEGQAIVSVLQNGVQKRLEHPLTRGNYFGERALVENAPRSATVTADGLIKVAYLDRGSFERLLGPCLELMKRNISTYQQLIPLSSFPDAKINM